MGIPYAEVIGDPITHSKSPAIHKFWLEKLGIEGDYRATRVTAAELPAYLVARRSDPDWRGCNVTMPHKTRVAPFLDCLDLGAESVNCIAVREGRLVGMNTDAVGLDLAWPDVAAGRQICVIGAGGAARAAFASLDMICAMPLHLIARNSEQAGILLEPHGGHGRWFAFERAHEALADCVGVVNASPLGMTGFPEMPETVLDGLARMKRGGFALDMVYDPPETALLGRATQLGLRAIDGFTMLIGQATYAFYHFFGASAPREHDRELRELLTS